MPTQPTYPGVYIEEVPSGVRTITGVATSIAAFIGRALRGPVNLPVILNSYGDFERQFGGLWAEATLGYAVRDFYQNGGSRAVVVRVAKGAVAATTALPVGDPLASPPVLGAGFVVLEAVNPGSWGGRLQASVNHKTKDPTIGTLFNLTVAEAGGAVEAYFNVSSDSNDPRFLPRVLAQSSALVRVQGGAMPLGRPNDTTKLNQESPPALINAPVDASVALDSDGQPLNPDGQPLTAAEYTGSEAAKTGIYALRNAEFNLLCVPPPVRGADTPADVYQKALGLCLEKRVLLLVDPPAAWGTSAATAIAQAEATLSALGLAGSDARNAALYFPLVWQADPQRDGQTDTFVPCGLVAGIMARTDASRGVWKSPAGLDASLNGVQGLQVNLTDAENGNLNPLGINCLRQFPVTGRVVWGARTLRGADQLADTDNKYVAVRRTMLFLEESLYRGTQWVVFEPNDEPLWAQIRLNVGAFMNDMFRQGAFQGRTPREAYLVKCDRETTTQTDINQGVVNVLVGFAPLKPAEFVFIKIQQLSGQIDT